MVVVSSAIKPDNPELVAARAKRLPVVRRAEMLAELMRLKSCIAVAGTHGKTTTTSMVAALLDAGGLDPTVINGGIINAYGTNARLGAGDWMVVEADESDGTFLKLPADIAIVTNVDAEHLDHFKTFQSVQDAFVAFMENVPFYGFVVMCTDHPIVQRLVGRVVDRRIITYGENPQADVRLVDLDHAGGKSHFSVLFRDRDGKDVHAIRQIRAADAGPAQRAQCHRGNRGRARARIRRRRHPQGARRFRWREAALHPRRRMERRDHHRRLRPPSGRDRRRAQGRARVDQGPGDRGGAAASLHAAKTLFEQFCTCFNDADAVIVADVYPAGEAPIEGVDRDIWWKRSARTATARSSARRPDKLAGDRQGLAKPGDYVVCLGAGSITQWAYALPAELKALE